MSHRALIVAIEDYTQVGGGGVAAKLDGTLQAGRDFKKWLEDKWGKAEVAEPQIIFCSEPKEPGGRGASRKDIIAAMMELAAQGAGQTEELYVYLSGHGFAYSRPPEPEQDVIIAADFVDNVESGHCCLSINYMVYWLAAHLGTGLHAYIVNSCRNVLDHGQVAPHKDFLPFGPQVPNSSSTFMIHAALNGDVAPVNSRFHRTLMEGLKGTGRAKEWDENEDAMHVRHSSLSKYLSSQLKVPIDGSNEGPYRDMEFVSFRPAPRKTCTIRVRGPASPVGTVSYRSIRDGNRRTEVPLDGATTVLEFAPDMLRFSVNVEGATVEPAESDRIDLFEDAVVSFTATPAPSRAGRGPAGFSAEAVRDAMAEAAGDGEPGKAGKFETIDRSDRAPAGVALAEPGQMLTLVVPPGCRLKLTNIDTRKTSEHDNTATVELWPATYIAVLFDRHNREIGRREFDMPGGVGKELNLARWQDSLPHRSIAGGLDARDGWVWFSESLGGPVIDPDLDLWLALAGAGRILTGGAFGSFDKLDGLPLLDFRAMPKGSSPIYVLAGAVRELKNLQVAVSSGARVRWQAARSPQGMKGIYEARVLAEPGPQLLSLRVNGGASYTIATCAAENRAMLVTIAFDAAGAPTISQYLLPIGTLAQHLPEYPLIQRRQREKAPLEDVRFLANATSAFRRRRHVVDEHRIEVLWAKWIDPITSALVAYDQVRRGRAVDLHEVVRNMNQYFGYLPDSAALRVLAGGEAPRPSGAPIFSDGLRAFPELADWLPLPPSHLDFSSPWTAWVAAVAAKAQPKRNRAAGAEAP
jgi:hypothetical protein